VLDECSTLLVLAFKGKNPKKGHLLSVPVLKVVSVPAFFLSFIHSFCVSLMLSVDLCIMRDGAFLRFESTPPHTHTHICVC